MHKKPKKIHFIAIGGSAMHNLALALHDAGNIVTGSDDAIYGASSQRLKEANIHPDAIGWFPEKIHQDLDAVILGMHAKSDNPELLQAQKLNLPILSLPEYIYKNSINKQRIVIAGSHGKTTVTSMIIHALKNTNKDFDFLVGAQVEGFDRMVKLTDAPTIILEGDEYLSSCLDPKPKFMNYQHHIAVITGISWDHANVFNNPKIYTEQFEQLIHSTPRAGSVIYCDNDSELKKIMKGDLYDVNKISYGTFPHKFKKGVLTIGESYHSKEVSFYGEHNLYNLSAAWHVVQRMGMEMEEFVDAMASFNGAKGRLEKLAESPKNIVIRDFAHSPSKLKATIDAVEKKYYDKKVLAVFELHTYSSLSKDFIGQYRNSMDAANELVVFYSPDASKHKGLEVLDNQTIVSAFNNKKLHVFNDVASLEKHLLEARSENKVLLLMSSGTFDGLDIQNLATNFI